MGNIKQINIKNRTYYFHNNIINIEEFDSNLLKIDQKLYKDIDIYKNRPKLVQRYWYWLYWIYHNSQLKELVIMKIFTA